MLKYSNLLDFRSMNRQPPVRLLAWVDNVSVPQALPGLEPRKYIYDRLAPSGCITRWSSVSASREVVQVRRTPSADSECTSDSPTKEPQLRTPVRRSGPGGLRWASLLTYSQLQLILSRSEAYTDGVWQKAVVSPTNGADAQAPADATPACFLHRFRTHLFIMHPS